VRAELWKMLWEINGVVYLTKDNRDTYDELNQLAAVALKYLAFMALQLILSARVNALPNFAQKVSEFQVFHSCTSSRSAL